jgi:cell division septal protein FtsQ
VAQQIPQLVLVYQLFLFCLLACLFVVTVSIYHTPRRTLSQLKKYSFSGERKTTGQGDAIASEEQ